MQCEGLQKGWRSQGSLDLTKVALIIAWREKKLFLSDFFGNNSIWLKDLISCCSKELFIKNIINLSRAPKFQGQTEQTLAK